MDIFLLGLQLIAGENLTRQDMLDMAHEAKEILILIILSSMNQQQNSWDGPLKKLLEKDVPWRQPAGFCERCGERL